MSGSTGDPSATASNSQVQSFPSLCIHSFCILSGPFIRVLLSYLVLSCLVLPNLILSCLVWSYLISSYLVLSYLIFLPHILPYHFIDLITCLFILSYLQQFAPAFPHPPYFFPHNQSTPSSAIASGSAAVEDPELLSLLVSMGFSSNGCRRGIQATGATDPDTVMNWYNMTTATMD